MAVMSGQNRQQLGRWGEEAAAAYLRGHGFAILRRRYRCPRGEVDLVCREGRTLVFVEVKTRSHARAGHPEEAVTPCKQRRLLQVASYFLAEHGLRQVPFRFDVVAVEVGCVTRERPPRIRHYRHAFGGPAT